MRLAPGCAGCSDLVVAFSSSVREINNFSGCTCEDIVVLDFETSKSLLIASDVSQNLSGEIIIGIIPSWIHHEVRFPQAWHSQWPKLQHRWLCF